VRADAKDRDVRSRETRQQRQGALRQRGSDRGQRRTEDVASPEIGQKTRRCQSGAREWRRGQESGRPVLGCAEVSGLLKSNAFDRGVAALEMSDLFGGLSLR